MVTQVNTHSAPSARLVRISRPQERLNPMSLYLRTRVTRKVHCFSCGGTHQIEAIGMTPSAKRMVCPNGN